MEKTLRKLLGGARERPFSLGGETLTMRLLSAWDLLELHLSEKENDAFEEALHGGAALTAKTLQRNGEPVFPDAESVLRTLSAEEINRVLAEYRRWSAEIDPGLNCGEEEIEALKKASCTHRRSGCAGAC